MTLALEGCGGGASPAVGCGSNCPPPKAEFLYTIDLPVNGFPKITALDIFTVNPSTGVPGPATGAPGPFNSFYLLWRMYRDLPVLLVHFYAALSNAALRRRR